MCEMADYKEFLDSIDRKAYHEGEVTWEEDGYTVTRTYNYSAPGCHDSCGLLFYTKDNQLVKVEGDPLDPCTNGRLCIRCLDLPEATNHADRIKYPLKRAGERGENKWERITWDEAFDTIIDYIHNEIDGKGFGRESIFVNHGTGRNINWQVPFLGAAALGTPNIGAISGSGYACYLPRVCGTAAPMGDFFIADASMTHPDRYLDDEWLPPSLIVVWGCEPLRSNADGYIGHWLVQCVQMGAKIISIDPVLTWWGARAEYWLPVHPGTDECLALAWLNVITQEDLIDHEFVEYWCAYYDEMKEHVAQFTPEWAAKETGVPVEDIIGSARLYAQAERACIQWGLAFDMQMDSMELCLTVSNIAAVCGNIDKPGTNIIVRNAFEINPGYALAELYCDPVTWSKKRSYAAINPNAKVFIGMADCDAMGITMETGEPYPFKMAWIQSSNALGCCSPSLQRTYANLKKFDFVVVADPVMTPTAVAAADIVLPVAMSCERDSMRVWWTPLRALKKVTSYYEAKSDEEIMVELGNRLNPKLFNKRWPTLEAFLQDYLDTGFNVIGEDGKGRKAPGRNKAGAIITDDIHTKFWHEHDGKGTFKTLFEGGGYEYDKWNQEYFKYEKGLLREDGTPGFNTPTGRYEFVPSTYVAWDIDPYPIHHKSYQQTKWIEDPKFKETYPYTFINGARSFEFFHSEHRQLQTMRELHPWPIVKVNPKTAEKYGLKDGDWLWMENMDGRCRQRVKIFPGIKDDCVSCEHGWWFPELEPAEPILFGTFDSNPNCLTHSYETGSAGVGAPVKNVVCKIYKYEEGDTLPTMQITRLGGFRDHFEVGKP
jgi:anaerobic selenocysteine-containing dehydrogenase